VCRPADPPGNEAELKQDSEQDTEQDCSSCSNVLPGGHLKIFLARHGKAVSRTEWAGDAILRPLTEMGHAQARAVARHLSSETIERIVSGPALACQQSVEPLTLATGVQIEVDERIGDGETLQRFLELFPAHDGGATVFCTHREHILGLLRLFELSDAASTDGAIPCK